MHKRRGAIEVERNGIARRAFVAGKIHRAHPILRLALGHIRFGKSSKADRLDIDAHASSIEVVAPEFRVIHGLPFEEGIAIVEDMTDQGQRSRRRTGSQAHAHLIAVGQASLVGNNQAQKIVFIAQHDGQLGQAGGIDLARSDMQKRPLIGLRGGRNAQPVFGEVGISGRAHDFEGAAHEAALQRHGDQRQRWCRVDHDRMDDFRVVACQIRAAQAQAIVTIRQARAPGNNLRIAKGRGSGRKFSPDVDAFRSDSKGVAGKMIIIDTSANGCS